MIKNGVLLNLFFSCIFTAFCATTTPVPMEKVSITNDAFWSPKLTINRTNTVPHMFEKTISAYNNFKKAAGLMSGGFQGYWFQDTDVHKTIEAASWSLLYGHDQSLINKMSGYLDSYQILNNYTCWSDLPMAHEMYVAGHMIEGACAHYRVTRSEQFLDLAKGWGDCLDANFGPDKNPNVGGHPEIELALAKLYIVTGEQKYFDLAEWFINQHGTRPNNYGAYYVDFVPVRQMSDFRGCHAVRANYFATGAADIAIETGETTLIDACKNMWERTITRKMYVNGGAGATGSGEAYGADYYLPRNGYLESCAACGLLFFSDRMFQIDDNGRYIDIIEKTLYNAILCGVALDGKSTFYSNPLENDGSLRRSSWHGCACCPPNISRTLFQIGGNCFSIGQNALYVNLYVSSQCTTSVGRTAVEIVQKTAYPWEERISVKVNPEQANEFSLNLRIPGWCYSHKIWVNNSLVNPTVSKGYARINRTWTQGDSIVLELHMPVLRMVANPQVQDCNNRVALQRGPIVYAFEGIDNDDNINIALPKNATFTTEYNDDLLNGVVVIKTKTNSGRDITAIPMYAWANRPTTPRKVWVNQENITYPSSGWDKALYQPMEIPVENIDAKHIGSCKPSIKSVQWTGRGIRIETNSLKSSAEQITVALYNVLGRELFIKKYSSVPTFIMPEKHLTTGVYFLQMNSKNWRYNGNVFVVR